MSVLSFLKKAEQEVAKVLGLAAKLEPEAALVGDAVAVAAGHPEVAAAINKIGAVVTGAGAIVSSVQGAAGTGAQKLALAWPQVDQLIKHSGFLGTKAIANETKWSAAVEQLTGAVADMYDSIADPAPAPAPAEHAVAVAGPVTGD